MSQNKEKPENFTEFFKTFHNFTFFMSPYTILKKKIVHTSSKDCIIHSHFESAVPSPEQIKMMCKIQKRKH